VHTDTDKAELLSNYFSSVFTINNGIIDPSRLPDIQLTNSAVPPVFFTPPLISKYIKALKRNGSAGPDGLPAEFFKETSNIISFPLTVIFNLSLQTGDLPDMWKNASVTPVFKKGSPCAPENYRPISLTCISCKLLKCGIKDSLLQHLLLNNLINSRSGMDIIYLDFAKAFDSVVHNKLMAKLACYGINNMLLAWISNFLIGRVQYVRIANACSVSKPVISGHITSHHIIKVIVPNHTD